MNDVAERHPAFSRVPFITGKGGAAVARTTGSFRHPDLR